MLTESQIKDHARADLAEANEALAENTLKRSQAIKTLATGKLPEKGASSERFTWFPEDGQKVLLHIFNTLLHKKEYLTRIEAMSVISDNPEHISRVMSYQDINDAMYTAYRSDEVQEHPINQVVKMRGKGCLLSSTLQGRETRVGKKVDCVTETLKSTVDGVVNENLSAHVLVLEAENIVIKERLAALEASTRAVNASSDVSDIEKLIIDTFLQDRALSNRAIANLIPDTNATKVQRTLKKAGLK